MSGRGRAAGIIALIVICSALAGAAIERLRVQDSMRHRGGGGGPPSRGSPEMDARRRAEMLDRLTRDLTLSDVQRAGIDSVMRRTDSSLHAIRVDMQPRLKAVFAASREEMRARLTPEQRTKFERDTMPRRGNGPDGRRSEGEGGRRGGGPDGGDRRGPRGGPQ